MAQLNILLPISTAEELALFAGLPLRALLASGNLPSVQNLFQVKFCILAPQSVIRLLETSDSFNALKDQSSLVCLLIDDLVLDSPFDVVPSLAYRRGIYEVSKQSPALLLQPNLVVAEGGIFNLAQRLLHGAGAVTATYLRVDRAGFAKPAERSCRASSFAARTLLERAFECLDPRDLANVVNLDLPISGPSGRLFWRQGRRKLVSYDFVPSLIALCPATLPDNAFGFRDTAFARLMCPDCTVQHIPNSDEFLGLELVDAVPEGEIKLALSREDRVVRELAPQAAFVDYAKVCQARTEFVVGEPIGEHDNSELTYVKRLVKSLPQGRPTQEDPRWAVALYLWDVRRFELGRGPLPSSPFEALLARFESVPSRQDAAWSVLARIARRLRHLLFGRVPLVTMLHPDWLDYRCVRPVLRRADASSTLYIGDGQAVLGRLLGPPAFGPAQVLAASFDQLGPAPASLRLALGEVSSLTVTRSAELISRLLPYVEPGGKIVLFYRAGSGSAGVPQNFSDNLAKASLTIADRSLTFSLVPESPYRSWLRRAFQIAADYVRLRQPWELLKGTALLLLINTLTLVFNAAALVSRRRSAVKHGYSSATIIVDV